MFVKVAHCRHFIRFNKKDKLAPRYVRLFKVLECVSKVAYWLALQTRMDRIHDIFHVSMLRKYISDPTYMLSIRDIELKDDLVYEEHLVQILVR